MAVAAADKGRRIKCKTRREAVSARPPVHYRFVQSTYRHPIASADVGDRDGGRRSNMFAGKRSHPGAGLTCVGELKSETFKVKKGKSKSWLDEEEVDGEVKRVWWTSPFAEVDFVVSRRGDSSNIETSARHGCGCRRGLSSGSTRWRS